MTRKVIPSTNLRARLPVVGPLVFLLLLDRLGAPGYVYGFLAACTLFVWAAVIVERFTTQEVDPYK